MKFYERVFGVAHEREAFVVKGDADTMNDEPAKTCCVPSAEKKSGGCWG